MKWSGTMDFGKELQATNNYLKALPVMEEPFRHFLLRKPFSERLYKTLLVNLPDDDDYDWGRSSTDSERERGTFYLNRHHLGRLSPEQRTVWQQVRRWALSSDFYATIIGKYQDAIRERFARETPGSCLLGEVKLIRDKTGYALQPHTDRPNRVTTIMFYLPPDNSLEEYGTALYRPRKKGMSCSGFQRHPFEDFELISKAPFVPNSGLCFLRSDTGFHGVEPLQGAGISRDFLTFSIRCVNEDIRKKARRHLSRLRGNQQNYVLGRITPRSGLVDR